MVEKSPGIAGRFLRFGSDWHGASDRKGNPGAGAVSYWEAGPDLNSATSAER